MCTLRKEDAQTFDPISAHDALLAEATGAFAHAGGTGGQGGSVYYVTNLNDAGPGSLRDALTRTEPLIILFENGLNGTINISSGDINVRSNKTVWGRHRDGSSADIFIHPTNRDSPFNIEGGNKNIIIANLKGDAPGPNDAAPDFIGIYSSLVWVHHVTVTGDGTSDMDGFVDIYGTDVTISWSRILDWSNVHLLNGADRITLDHNLYRNSAGRHPKASDATGVRQRSRQGACRSRGESRESREWSSRFRNRVRATLWRSAPGLVASPWWVL